MTEEKYDILTRIDNLITKRKNILKENFSYIHEIDDGIIIRMFTDWDNCDKNESIKYRKIKNDFDSGETLVFFYIPQGTILDNEKREYIKTITSLSGTLELKTENETILLTNFNKISLKNNVFEGTALENTYVLTSNKH